MKYKSETLVKVSTIVYTVHCTLDMVEFFHFSKKSLSKVFGCTKFHKKGSRNIFLFLLKKIIMILREFSSSRVC